MKIKPARVNYAIFKNICLVAIPTVVMTTAALFYAATKSDMWSASQGLVLRDEVAGNFDRLGQFESTDAMQTAAETVLEIARHPSVIRPALKDVGPPEKDANISRGWSPHPLTSAVSWFAHSLQNNSADWPTRRQIEGVRHNIRISAPQGAQFGRTELIYLWVTQEDPSRAVKLTSNLSNRLQERLMILRKDRYASVVSELSKSYTIAEEELAAATAELRKMEKEVGPDLVELRVMTDSGTGSGTLRRLSTDVAGEMRQAKSAHVALLNNRQQLVMAQQNPNQLLAAHNELVASFPTLKRLTDGLVDAKLIRARLQGVKNDEHPQVMAARFVEKTMKLQIREELAAAIRGVDANLAVGTTRSLELERQWNQINIGLAKLADLRAPYSNLMAEVESRNNYLESVQHKLAEARASQLASEHVSLLTCIDAPVLNANPDGPGRTTIVAAGLLSGLATGLGLVFLLAPVAPAVPAPLNKSLFSATATIPSALARAGRRTSDFLRQRNNDGGGRRQTDSQPFAHQGNWAVRRDSSDDSMSPKTTGEPSVATSRGSTD